ncbi:MAG: translation elongation factor 4 [bacterium]|nr:translation elongation factor 4 [bacterium]
MNNIRNFVIIAHIDHGKSTLADRLLEATTTVEARRMKPQYLDQMELERERGITIKMAPVRMKYHPESRISNLESRNVEKVLELEHSKLIQNSKFKIRNSSSEYILNLIDTPGHSDFAYEVSRALAAVEGAVLLVDASQGIQAQTLANFHNAKKAGLTIIGAVNKIDLKPPMLDDVVQGLAALLECSPDDILRVSGKTGEGVEELLRAVVERVPPPASPQLVGAGPREGHGQKQALIFDSRYDDHKGAIAFVRVKGGQFKSGEELVLMAAKERCKAKEVGYFHPQPEPAPFLNSGEIGYIATGIKSPGKIKIGDTIASPDWQGEALPGYQEPLPVVFVAFYPAEESDYDDLKRALEELKLSDSALQFEPEVSEVLGRGFTCGFLGRLHFEITAERLVREFGLATVNSFPSVTYNIKEGTAWRTVKHPRDFPDHPDQVLQPVVRVEILTPPAYLGNVLRLKEKFHMSDIRTETFLPSGKAGSHSVMVRALMPLADLIRDFDDNLKSLSEGFASLNYELAGEAPGEVVKLEIVVADEAVPGLTRIVAFGEMEREGRTMVERLKELLPRQQFAQAIQARVRGRIIARETIPAFRKDVTGYLYGGDRTRKMKLWKKQKRGKERLKASGKVILPASIFKELLKK